MASHWTRTVGSVHLVLAGVGNVAVAVGLGVLVASGELVPLLVDVLPTVVDEVNLVANAPSILTAATAGGPVLAAFLLLVGVLQLYGGVQAYRARRWTFGIVAGVLGAVNPLVFPVALVAVVLIGLSRSQFSAGDRG